MPNAQALAKFTNGRAAPLESSPRSVVASLPSLSLMGFVVFVPPLSGPANLDYRHQGELC